ncbi:MAG TPA: hypothetical protein VMR21_02700 [Vicinamibacteria bacterium]|nr:hypothetical protein [Vicinamibacteria bacterium]
MTRGTLRGAAAALLVAVGMAGGGTPPASAQADPERVRTAKTLFFDRKYAEARRAWQAVRAAGGPEAEAAAYWVARSSESLGENERAFEEYGAFLALPPKDRALREEARTSRVGLAARLYRTGAREHASILRAALSDSSKTVRYYAALQMSGLDREMGRLAAPVLRRILAEEKDADLVDRAKLGLLRWDAAALSGGASAERSRGGEAHWVRLRITEKGSEKAKVAITLPLGLAEMIFKSLPDDVKVELRKGGYEAETFWDRLRRLGPSEIISIEGDDGGRIQIWTEE